MSRDLKRSIDQMVIWLYGLEPLEVSHHHAKCVANRHSGSGDIIFLFSGGINQQVIFHNK